MLIPLENAIEKSHWKMQLKISLENAIEKGTWKMALQNAICKNAI